MCLSGAVLEIAHCVSSGVVLEIVHCVSQWGSIGDCSLCVSVG